MVGLDNPIHLIFLLVIVLLIFGAKRLPEMGRSLGSGLRGFKESLNDDSSAEVSERPVAEPAPALTDAIEAPEATTEPEQAAEQLETRTAA